jgi:pimeloyl-ACP methyl ester carboxylesterase
MASPDGGYREEIEADEIGGRSMTKKDGATAVGTLLGELPYVRFGNGSQNLVILPGITLENGPPSRFAAWTYRLGFGRFAEDHTVYVVNRRRGMPPGYTTQDMAADYARAIEGELGPSHVVGFSTGGEIAQYVAIDHPDAVLSLALIVSASRLSEEGRQTCERWHALTREGRWQELHSDMASATVTGERNKRLAGAFMKVFGRIVLGAPSDPSDFLSTLEADLGHDTTGRLPEISAPTLIVGGSDDPFYSEGILRETAEGIPDATLRLYEGVGHGVPKERKRQYESDVLAFLEGSLEGSSGGRLRTISDRIGETG